MTPEEVGALSQLGESIYQNLVNVICTCVMYGLYILAFSTAMYLFQSKPIKRLMRGFRLLLIVVLLSVSYEFGTRTGPGLAIVFLALVHPSNPTDLSDSIVKANDSPKFWESYAYWGPTFNLLISDGLVLWRAWVILDVRQKRRRRLLGYTIVLLMLGNIGVNIATAIIDNTTHSVHISAGAVPLDWISLVVSLLINAFATFLIGLKTWQIYQEDLHHNSEFFQAKKILLTLVESGLVFCIVQILYAISNALEINSGNLLSRTSLIYAMFTAVANGLAALYPVVLIIILHMEASPLIVNYDLSTVDPELTSIAIEMMDMRSTSMFTSGFSGSAI
jgi:hypothetical protein